MKPILIISYTACEKLGYLYEFIDKRKVAFEKITHEDDELASRKKPIKVIMEEN